MRQILFGSLAGLFFIPAFESDSLNDNITTTDLNLEFSRELVIDSTLYKKTEDIKRELNAYHQEVIEIQRDTLK